jgi:hypothetical protein
MNTVQKIESFSYPTFRRRNDRLLALNQTMQRVEWEHARRLRRLTLLLASATVLLIINGVLVVTLG